MQPSSPRERQIQSSADSGALDCRLADFRFRGKLGHGAYGIVYRAQAMTDNTPVPRGGVVAMKIVVNQFCRTSAVSHRFAHEYGLLRLIDPHPNINRYYGQWQERPSDEMVRLWPDFFREEAQVDVGGTLRNRTAQIVLLRYHNLSLAKYMKDVRGCLPEATFIRLAGGALAGLAHLASYHIAHLDVKPNNVMVDTTDPRRPTLVFIDFGCAQQFVGWRLPRYALTHTRQRPFMAALFLSLSTPSLSLLTVCVCARACAHDVQRCKARRQLGVPRAGGVVRVPATARHKPCLRGRGLLEAAVV